MKTLALTLATIATTAFAGHEIAGPAPVKPAGPLEPCFGETELQLDIFGTYHHFDGGTAGDGWGPGLSLNYFFHRNFGVQLDGGWFAGDDDGWFLGGNFLARYPFEIGGICLAPYAKIGGGYFNTGDNESYWGGGLGLEWRATPVFGIFGEANYYRAGNSDEIGEVRAGVRLAF